MKLVVGKYGDRGRVDKVHTVKKLETLYLMDDDDKLVMQIDVHEGGIEVFGRGDNSNICIEPRMSNVIKITARPFGV